MAVVYDLEDWHLTGSAVCIQYTLRSFDRSEMYTMNLLFDAKLPNSNITIRLDTWSGCVTFQVIAVYLCPQMRVYGHNVKR